MRTYLILNTVIVGLFLSGSSRAQDGACLREALTQYNRANLLIMQEGGIPMSPTAIIAQRRLEEAYCHPLAFCMMGEPRTPDLQIGYAAEFSKCLRNEALEKYEAVLK